MQSSEANCSAQHRANAGRTLSVITICRNESASIGVTVRSVLSQSSQEFEWIVMDGASTDGTVDILERTAGSRVNILISEPDRGIYDAMNKAIQRATGEYVLFLNGGDEFHDAQVVETCLSLLGSADIIHGGVQVFQNGAPRNAPIFGCQPADVPLQPEFFYRAMIPHQAVLIRRKLFTTIGPHDARYRIAGDREWLHRAAAAGARFHATPLVFANFFLGGISTSAATKRLCDVELRRFQIRRFPVRYVRDQIKAAINKNFSRTL